MATGHGSGTPGPARSSWRFPKLRSGSYFPDWLLQHRRRAEQALVSVVATSYLLGVSTRRVEKLAGQLGVKQLSKSQVSEMAQHLDAQVVARSGRLDQSTSVRCCQVPPFTGAGGTDTGNCPDAR